MQRWSIRAVAVVAAVMFAGSTVLTPLYPLYASVHHLSRFRLTLLYSVYVVGNLVALLFFGRLSDQIGRKRVMLGAAALGLASTLVFLGATGEAALFGGRALSGFAVGLGSGTAAAWLVDLHGKPGREDATTTAAASNYAGIAFGPLLAAAAIQAGLAPLRGPFAVYLVVLAGALALAAVARESRRERAPVALWPRVGVPRDRLGRFLPPAVATFGSYSLIGYYAALVPSILVEELHEDRPPIAGLVVGWMFAVSAVTTVLTRRLPSRRAMIVGLLAELPALAVLVAAQALRSWPLLLLATTLAGVAAAIAYRGALEIVNELAPAGRRAELVSVLYIIGFLGNSLPLIGVGLIAEATTPLVAGAVFAGVLALLALGALAVAARQK